MKTVLQGLIEELEDRKAFLHNTDCISESLEVDYVITLCKKRLEHDKRQIEEAIEDGYFGCCGKKTTVMLKGIFWESKESWDERKSVNAIIVNCKNKPELKVKCLHCGRKFISKLAHKCNIGYRKRNHNWEEL